jgi:acyl carrier protein
MADDSSFGVSKKRSEDEIRDFIRAVVIELAPELNEGPLEHARLVEDLGYHSLALLELAYTLEDEFDLPSVDPDTAPRIYTIGELEDFILELMKAPNSVSK